MPGVSPGANAGTSAPASSRIPPHKFFLDARSDVRCRRRFDELAAAGRAVTYDQVVAEITSRDLRDSTREDSPLTREDTFIDTSDATVDEVVERMARQIEGSLR